MNKAFLFSLLILIAQTQAYADSAKGEHTANAWDSNKTIQSWGAKKHSEGSFDSNLEAIKRHLSGSEKIDSEKSEFLTNWAKRLLNAQETLQKRAKEWLDDPTLNEESRSTLINRIVLYGERIKQVNEVIKKLEVR